MPARHGGALFIPTHRRRRGGRTCSPARGHATFFCKAAPVARLERIAVVVEARCGAMASRWGGAAGSAAVLGLVLRVRCLASLPDSVVHPAAVQCWTVGCLFGLGIPHL
ncbi:uncharacterized protein K452DRAFT_30679 [Aplosporella prunicola CBS 121167]|uniref:Uncharacterized protein n=1 Tax=Aplosporella prunicola CBS 121167 TaxID=1176127 RepID=A0A6A6BEA1_9PEZI|nr:uncharacterized protein K452DRAFT_30679 [Aplosporella prunicola CBS 121167]KAF2141594.1 hypothetical protein K452DRAFT_30679 [Aplosporella prunicola CBS 121167]